jgi:Tfp pilus assembly protein PilV
VSDALEVLMALVTVTVYALGLYALIAHRSMQSARVQAARVRTEERR